MLTPQEVSEHAFAKATFGGYNMAMVDEFLDLLTSDYTALYEENAALKRKLKVVSDKVEEYRATEDDMRKALMTARKMADELVQGAEDEKQAILQQAQQQAEDRVSACRQEIRDEEYRLTAARNATAVFVEKLRQQYLQELEYLDSLSRLTAPPASAPTAEDRVDQTVQEIESNVQRILAEESQAVPPEQSPAVSDKPEEGPGVRRLPHRPGPGGSPVPPPEDEEPEDEEEDAAAAMPTRRINLDRLEFGRNYEIK